MENKVTRQLKERESSLIEAVSSRRTRSVGAPLDEGVDVNAKGDDGRTALAVASTEGYSKVVNLLLNNGAQTETRDNDGQTPLWFAAANGIHKHYSAASRSYG